MTKLSQFFFIIVFFLHPCAAVLPTHSPPTLQRDGGYEGEGDYGDLMGSGKPTQTTFEEEIDFM